MLSSEKKAKEGPQQAKARIVVPVIITADEKEADVLIRRFFMPKIFGGQDIKAMEDSAGCAREVSRAEREEDVLIGFDVEWRPNFRVGEVCKTSA
jgi:hypothetical protein